MEEQFDLSPLAGLISLYDTECACDKCVECECGEYVNGVCVVCLGGCGVLGGVCGAQLSQELCNRDRKSVV